MGKLQLPFGLMNMELELTWVGSMAQVVGSCQANCAPQMQSPHGVTKAHEAGRASEGTPWSSKAHVGAQRHLMQVGLLK